MLKEYPRILEEGLGVFELLLTLISFDLTLMLYQHKGAIRQYPPEFYLGLVIVILPLWWILNKLLARGYSRRTVSIWSEAWSLAKANLIGVSLLIVGLIGLNPRIVHNRFLFYFIGINFLLVLALRISLRFLLRQIRLMGYNFRTLLLVGSNAQTKAYLLRIKTNPQLGYKVIGYVADSKDKDTLPLPYMGSVDQLEEIIKSQVIDQVVITLPPDDIRVSTCVDLLEQMGKYTTLIVDDFTKRLVNGTMTNFHGLAMLNYSPSPPYFFQLILKRTLDVFGSGAGIILLSPIFLITAAIIKLTSPGPVLFRQPRVGLNGRVFNCLKFRSMVVNAEEIKERLSHLNEMSGPVFKITNDPRVTRIGRFLRKTSIDELPQLFNVLKGDMSLVGPRPPLPNEVNMYENSHRKRLSVKPGITCIWQISGRNQVDFNEWMEMDALYVQNWSFWLDLKILLRTVPVVLLGKGAS